MVQHRPEKAPSQRKLRKVLGYIYLDTGAMYRALTYAALSTGGDLHDEEALHKLLQGIRITFSTAENEMQRVYLNEEDVTEAIRSEQVTQNVSLISSYAKVREEMVARQKSIARSGGVVMDGRDIGTVVLPDAEVKIFMTATAEERAAAPLQREHSEGYDHFFGRADGGHEAPRPFGQHADDFTVEKSG